MKIKNVTLPKPSSVTHILDTYSQIISKRLEMTKISLWIALIHYSMQLPAPIESLENFSKKQNSSNHHLVHSLANDPFTLFEYLIAELWKIINSIWNKCILTPTHQSWRSPSRSFPPLSSPPLSPPCLNHLGKISNIK